MWPGSLLLPAGQPFILLCHVREAKGLPVMDRATMLTDAYACTTFGKLSHRTEVQRKTLNPVWDERFRFEITDDELLVEGELLASRCGGAMQGGCVHVGVGPGAGHGRAWSPWLRPCGRRTCLALAHNPPNSPARAELLHVEVIDKDTLTTDDAIGSVILPLKPLVCTKEHDGVNVIQGWFPIGESFALGARGDRASADRRYPRFTS